jgi:hypothetical protein
LEIRNKIRLSGVCGEEQIERRIGLRRERREKDRVSTSLRAVS